MRRVDLGLEQRLQVLHLQARTDLVVDQLQDVLLGDAQETRAVNAL